MPLYKKEEGHISIKHNVDNKSIEQIWCQLEESVFPAAQRTQFLMFIQVQIIVIL